ncbi:piggyBac transposable element-derived protein 3-like isoform 1-T1 [Fundulus diaphanus]
MSSFSSQREFTNKLLTPAEDTFTDIKEIIVKSEEELNVSATTQIVVHSTEKGTEEVTSLEQSDQRQRQRVQEHPDIRQHHVKREDFSDQLRNSCLEPGEPDPPVMKEEEDELHLQIKEEGNELCISQDVLKQESETFPVYSTNEEKYCREPKNTAENCRGPKLITDQLHSHNGAAENQDWEENNDEDTELSSDEEPKQNGRYQETRGKFHKMDTKTYSARQRIPLALVPANPQDSDADLSDVDDDDPALDPDYQPTQAEDSGDNSFESLDEEESPSKGTSSVQPPLKRHKKGKHNLKTVCLEDVEDPSNPSSPSDQNKNTGRIWKYADIEEFEAPNPRLEPPEAVQTPFQYFKMLFTDEMIEHIAHHTNLYSAQKLGDSIKTSPKEIEDFIAILLLMGVFNFPSLADYWHHESRFSVVADTMSRNRFQLLRRFIHFSDNQQSSENPDRFYKIRPLFEMFRKQCLLIPSTYKQSVDEVMVAYKGTKARSLHQCSTNKPDKWGFKLFCRASSSGIIHDLLLYQGVSTFFNVALSEQEEKLPLEAKLMTTLCKTINQPTLSVVFCGIFFTSFSLVQRLHTSLGVKCIGAIRPNCTGGAPLMADKELMKKGRGAYDYRSAEGVIAVKWFDKKCVSLLSNAYGIMPLSTVNRWNKESRRKIAISCPSLIRAYNEHIGGIDLSDMLVHLYKTPAKPRRWYIPLFGYILDLCIANSWLIYKRDCGLLNQKLMSLKRFRLAVAHSLNQANKPVPKSGLPSFTSSCTLRPSRSKPQPDVRYDNLGHWPFNCHKRGRCNLCPKGVSRWKCQKCNVFLCLNTNKECFVAYHQK